MNLTHPIRDKDLIEKMQTLLLKQCYRDYMLFKILINFGFRISTACKLKVSDLRGKQHVNIKEQKTNKMIRLKINPQMQEEINRYTTNMSDDDYMFKSKKGGYITRVQAYRILNKASEQLGFKCSGHTCRKTYGRAIYDSTHSVAVLMTLFQHGNEKTSLRYIDVESEELDSVMDSLYL